MIGSLCGGCFGLGVAGLGGLLGGLGLAGVAAGGGNAGANEAAAVGGLTLALGIAYVAIGIVSFIGAILMLMGRRKGFSLTMIAMLALTVLSVVLAVTGGGGSMFAGFIIDGALAYYCWGRLNGKIGPPVSE